MKRLVICLSFVAVLTGCAADDAPAATEGCASTRECEFREVCDILAATCRPETDQRVVGSFYCANVYGATVSDTGQSGIGSFSEVAGRVNLPDPKGGRSEARVNVIAPPLCQLVDGVLYVLFFDIDVKTLGIGSFVHLTADVAKLQAGQLVDTSEPTNYRIYAARGDLATLKTAYQQAGDRTAHVWVEQVPVVGQPLHGFIDVEFEDVLPTP